MKILISATALGALFACGCNLAFAQATTTITQQGSGNTAYTEQTFGNPPPEIPGILTAVIEQIGNNNHVGDPLTKTPGIFQRSSINTEAIATIRQHGNGNNASIFQDGTFERVPVQISQVGNNNTAAITQLPFVQHSEATLNQTGNENVAIVEQERIIDSGFRAIQTGSGNYLLLRQERSSLGGPIITQTGSANSVTFEQDGVFPAGGDNSVDQNGTMNTVNSIMRDVEFASNTIQQTGTGNTVTTDQRSGGGLSSVIVQNGGNNLAALTQVGFNDSSRITQTGNDNRAYVRQIGDSFVASITQTGNGNSAGIYQH